MLKKLFYNIDSDNKKLFMNDYKMIHQLKELGIYNQDNINQVPFIEKVSIFDSLGSNKYNYAEYIRQVCTNEYMYATLDYLEKKDINKYLSTKLRYTIIDYIGLMSEWCLIDELKKNEHCIYVNRNDDIKKGIDFKCDDNSYQVKNISFLYKRYNMERYNDTDLNFIFYSIDIDNVNYLLLDNKPVIKRDEIDSDILSMEIKRVSLNEYIKLFEKGNICKQ